MLTPSVSSQAGVCHFVLSTPTAAAISITTAPCPSENSEPQ
jgi:hypothetical protein